MNDLKTLTEKMHDKSLYLPVGEQFELEQLKRLDMVFEYNSLKPSMIEQRRKLLKEMFAEFGEDSYVETPFFSNWGGKHVHFGNGVYANYNLTLVDDTHIYVGDKTMFGPGVTVATAGHPVLPELREEYFQFNAPVRIGRRCWIGAGVIILPGVTVGDDSVIGAGSVVTKDVPERVVAAGNPCRVLRPINEKDREYYFKDLKIPDELSERLK